MPVVSERGVVGRVVEVSSSYAKVLLLTDYSSSIPAMIQKNRLEGVLSGRSNDTLSLKYVEKTDDVASGDVVVTSGGDGVFPKGLPLGTISRVEKPGHDLHLVIDVMPMARFEHLEEVLVILTKPHPFVSQRVNPEGSGGDAG
jgi:rod shape-determining protein MreC